MLAAPLLKALTFLVGIVVSLVPALAPPGFMVDGDDAPTASDAAAGAGRLGDALVSLDDLVNASARDQAAKDAAAADGDGDADDAFLEVNFTANDSSTKNATYVKPKPQPKPAPFTGVWDDPTPIVHQGGAVPLVLTVTNHHGAPLQLKAQAMNVTQGWRVVMLTDWIEVQPGESAEVPATFEAPFLAKPGAVGRFTLAIGSAFPVHVATFPVHARIPVPEVIRDVGAGAGDGTRYAKPGDWLNYTVNVQNLGSANDSMRVGVSGGTPGWAGTLEATRVTLEPGEVKSIRLTVRVPAGAKDGEASFFNVTAQSESAPTAFATAPTLTVVDVENSGLPVDLGPICVTRPVEVPYEAEPYVEEQICVDLAALGLGAMLPPVPDETADA